MPRGWGKANRSPHCRSEAAIISSETEIICDCPAGSLKCSTGGCSIRV